jgi:hypothetical protein
MIGVGDGKAGDPSRVQQGAHPVQPFHRIEGRSRGRHQHDPAERIDPAFVAGEPIAMKRQRHGIVGGKEKLERRALP